MHEHASELGNILRLRRRELGLQQVELAEMAGVSTRFVHSAEHGKPSMQLDKLMSVLAVLGLELAIVPVGGRG